MKQAMTMTAAAVATVLSLAACGSDDDATAGTTMSSTSTASPSEGSAAEGEHNEADVMFAQMMIPHHAQAIEMSEVVLAKDGVDTEVLDLAERIKDAQQPEIDQMSGWLEAWGAEMPDMSMGSMDSMEGMDHGGMGGMMSEQDMQALEDADGAAASRLFLEQMVEHHTGAIEMAQAQVADGQNAEAVALAETIIVDQQAEITEMRDLLASL